MILKSQKGSALVMALLIGFMGTVIGTALYHVSSTNAKQVQKIEDQLQADYYAESGVNLALGIITNHYNDDSYFANERKYFGTSGTLSEYVTDTELTDNYTIDLSIVKSGDEYVIKAIGITRRGQQGTGQSSSLSTSDAQYQISDDLIRQIANNGQNGTSIVQKTWSGVFADNSIKLDKDACITGNTTINSKSADSISFDPKSSIVGNLYYLDGEDDNDFLALANYVNGSVISADSFPTYVLPSFPTGTDQSSLPDNLDIKKDSISLPDTGNFFDFNSITVGKKGCLKIDLNRDIVIVTNSLVVDGAITITGDQHTLTIYVNESCLFGEGNSSDKAVINSDNIPMQIISKGNISVNCDVWANIYAPESTLEIDKKGNVTGNVISNDITFNANNGGGNGNASINAGSYEMTVWKKGNSIYSGEYVEK